MKTVFRTVGLPILVGFLILAAYLYFHLGAYREVQVGLRHEPEMHLLYKTHRGAYHHIIEAISKVENWAKENKIPCPRTFGLYYDDPKSVDEARLKSEGGCILNEVPNWPSLPEGFSTRTLAAANYLVAEFTGSPAIGPWKVYPRLIKAWQEQDSANSESRSWPLVLEIYTLISGDQISTNYLIPLAKDTQPH